MRDNLIDKCPDKYWHICSGCGKREILSSKDAFEQGWDYPGPEGVYKESHNYGFGMMAPRTCGNCCIKDSLYWKLFISEEGGTNNMNKYEIEETLKRIKSEPMSLSTDIKPKYVNGNKVKFIFDNGREESECTGEIVITDVYDNYGDITYDISGYDYVDKEKKVFYKHIPEVNVIELIK